MLEDLCPQSYLGAERLVFFSLKLSILGYVTHALSYGVDSF